MHSILIHSTGLKNALAFAKKWSKVKLPISEFSKRVRLEKRMPFEKDSPREFPIREYIENLRAVLRPHINSERLKRGMSALPEILGAAAIPQMTELSEVVPGEPQELTPAETQIAA